MEKVYCYMTELEIIINNPDDVDKRNTSDRNNR